MSLSEAIPLCDPYIWEDPRYIFRMTWFDRDFERGTCASELINRILCVYLFVIVLGIVGTAITGISSVTVVFGLCATLYLLPTFMQLRSIELFKKSVDASTKGSSAAEPAAEPAPEPQAEGFRGDAPDCEETVSDVPGRLENLPFQLGTSSFVKNPFHNVLVNEYVDDPERNAAPDVTSVESKIALDDYFRVNWYNDPTDVFGKTQNQRMFITQPSTTIPNDQESYQNWLYKIDGKTCKEGGKPACYGGTNGAVLPWLNL